MFHHHTLIFFLATALGSLAEDYEFFKYRPRSYNSNANNNQLFGGYNAGLGRDVRNDRDRGIIYANPTKYDGTPKSGIGSGKVRGGLYVSPKYILRGNEDGGLGTGGLGTGGLGTGGLGTGGMGTGGMGTGGSGTTGLATGYDTIGDGIGYGSVYGDEICDSSLNSNPNSNQLYRYADGEEKTVSEDPRDDDGSPEELFIYNNNYNVVFKGNRRFIGYRPYGDRSGGWGSKVDNNPNNKVIGSRYRRTDSWVPLRTTYYIEREPSYVTDLQPSYVTDRKPTFVTDLQPSYETDLQPSYVTDRQPSYVADRQQTYSTERQPIYAGQLRPYQTTLPPDDDDYDRGYPGPNMNSNVNYNYLSGRRHNVNSNANNNNVGHGGYGHGRVQDRYHTKPSYSNYDQEGYNPVGTQGNLGGYAPHTTKWYQPSEFRPGPKDGAQNDDENNDDDDDDDDYAGLRGANVNSNSNTNILSRRSNLKTRKSGKKPLQRDDHDHKIATTVSDVVSTTRGIVRHQGGM